MRKTRLPKSSVASLAAGLLCFLLPSVQYAQVTPKNNGHGNMNDVSTVATSFQGGATVVSGVALGTSLSIVNCGGLAVTGGAQESSSIGESVAGVFTAGALHATAIGQGSVAASEASVADINV